MLCAKPAGLWASMQGGPRARDELAEAPAGRILVFGAVLASSWCFSERESAPLDDHHERMRLLSLRGTQAQHHLGYLDYPVRDALEFREPPSVAVPALPSCLAALATLPVNRSVQGCERNAGSFSDVMHQWQARCSKCPVFVELAPHAARMLSKGLWACLHSVALSLRTPRKRCLVQDEPPRKRMRAFLNCAQQKTKTSQAIVPCSAPAASRPSKTMEDPELVLDWLDASQHIRNLRKVGFAAIPYARIIARSTGLAPEQLTSQIRYIGYETLRIARLRADMVAMLLFRKFWSQTMAMAEGSTNVYIFCDASPTWRGVELWASSFDLFDGSRFLRRLFPVLALSPEMVDAIGKSLSLLWQIFLMAGPAVEMVRLFCGRVRAIITDMGVERKIGDMRDICEQLYGALSPGCRIQRASSQYMFPRALQVPGWKHQVDLLIRHGLTSMKFFPHWLAQLKAVNNFLRQDGYMQVLRKFLDDAGLHALSEALGKARFPNFAEWRWGTLFYSISALMPVLDSLVQHFNPEPFRRTREGSGLATVTGALRSREWRSQCDFVLWFTKWLTTLMAWGCGCSCHEEELRSGVEVSCPRKGRRLHEAASHLRMEMQRALEAANSWTADTWQCGAGFHVEAQGCVRLVHAMAQEKFAFLSQLPYLLAQLPLPGVKAEALRQWASAAPEAHHRVTREFMTEGSALRLQIDKMRPDGSGIGEQLRIEIESLRAIPMDDSVAEGPHARAKREQAHARGNRFPWVAASMRLGQNLGDCRDMVGATGADLRQLWCSWKSIAKVGQQGMLQNQRLKTPAFLNKVYRMSFLSAGRPEMLAIEDDGGISALADDDGPRPAGGQPLLEDRHSVEHRVQQALPGVSQEAACSHRRPMEKAKEEVRLMRQWLAAALQPFSYISVPTIGEEGWLHHQFFQILSLECRTLHVKTFVPEGEDEGEGLFVVRAQALERWRAPLGGPDEGPGLEAEVFIYVEPCSVDILTICGGSRASRRHWTIWQSQKSDLLGCVALHSPEPMAPRLPLKHPSTPALTLVDALVAQGFEGVSTKVVHNATSPMTFDNRGLSGKRPYLKCLLALPELLQAGVVEVHSGMTAAYYELVLHSKGPVSEKMPATKLRQLLAAAKGDIVEVALLDAPAKAPLSVVPMLPLPPPPVGRSAGSAGDSGSSIAGDDEPEVAGAHEQLAAIGSAAPAAGVLDDNEEVAGDEGGGVLAKPSRPVSILGQTVTYVKGRSDSKWSYNERISVKCRNPDHGQCKKSRSLVLDLEVFGPRAAEGFLGAWLLQDGLAKQEHGKYLPSRSEIRAFLGED